MRGISKHQNFLRFEIKDRSKLGNVNSIKGRDSFSRKFPRDFSQENRRRYARPVSRMDNGEPVEREQRRVEGTVGGWRVRSNFFFFATTNEERIVPSIGRTPRNAIVVPFVSKRADCRTEESHRF